MAKKHLLGSGCRVCGGSQKLTKELFLTRVNEKHQNKYLYVLDEYKNVESKILIICPEHGSFTQRAASHLRGNGCSKCANNYSLTTEEFIKQASLIHKNFYSYEHVFYQNNHINVKIVCPKHGEFMQQPRHHLNGHKC